MITRLSYYYRHTGYTAYPHVFRIRRSGIIPAGSVLLRSGEVAHTKILALHLIPFSALGYGKEIESSHLIASIPKDIQDTAYAFVQRERDLIDQLDRPESDSLGILLDDNVDQNSERLISSVLNIPESSDSIVTLSYCHISGTLSQQGMATLTLFDTGASKSLIRRADIPAGTQKWGYSGQPLRTPNNGALYPEGVASIFIRANDKTKSKPLQVYALIVDDLPYPLLLGTDLLGTYKAVID